MKKILVAIAVMLAVCFAVSAQEEGGSSSGVHTRSRAPWPGRESVLQSEARR